MRKLTCLVYSKYGKLLNDCPFCAGKEWPESEWDQKRPRKKAELYKEIYTTFTGTETRYFVRCHRCAATGPAYTVRRDPFGRYYGHQACKRQAAAAWNNRPERAQGKEK